MHLSSEAGSGRPDIQLTLIREYAGHSGAVFAMAALPAQRQAISAGDDGIVVRWELDDPEGRGEALLRAPHALYALHVVPERSLLLAGGSTGTIYAVDMAKRQILRSFAQSQDPVYGFFSLPGSSTIGVLHGGGYLSLLDAESLTIQSYRRLSEGHLRCSALDPQTGMLFIGASDGHIMALAPGSLELVQRWEAHQPSVFSLAVHPEHRYLLSGGRDAHLRSWDLRNHFAPIQALPAHLFTVNSIELSPNRRHWLTASRDKHLKIWDAESLGLQKVIDWDRQRGHRHSVNKALWLSDTYFISCGDDKRLLYWQIDISD